MFCILTVILISCVVVLGTWCSCCSGQCNVVTVYFITVLRKSIASGLFLLRLTLFVVAAATRFLCGWFNGDIPTSLVLMVLLRFVC